MTLAPAGKHRSRPDPNKALMYPLLLSAGLIFVVLYAILILFILAIPVH